MNGIESTMTAARVWDLGDDRFVYGDVNSVLGVNLLNEEEWLQFQDFWNTLEVDKYMNDGGKYRYRRFGRFKYFAEDDRLQPQPYGPYTQPTYFNPLNGGVNRFFGPLTEPMINSKVVTRLLKELGRVYSELEDVPMWKINTYFNRIYAAHAEVGKPVPEGMHRDGVKFSCLFMANMFGFTGGETSLYDLVEKQPIFKGRLAEPGDILLFRDDTVFHDTTPILPTEPDVPGYRDLLVIEFR
ncbi:2OG-Fe dioxygenase family protein [Trinickia mobilis]|uniref:2OG-Fe dioxygenase family protein n=1 Tax=Trinickia mobilis TaxID=2816356 RepID=UPI001A8E0F93|nr:2OG-Fe dioxygenase family protein [Trinickia mobilis]